MYRYVGFQDLLWSGWNQISALAGARTELQILPFVGTHQTANDNTPNKSNFKYPFMSLRTHKHIIFFLCMPSDLNARNHFNLKNEHSQQTNILQKPFLCLETVVLYIPYSPLASFLVLTSKT